MRVCLLALLLLASCGPNSLDDYHREGEARCRKLVKELRAIHTQEELVLAQPRLRQHFNQLVTLMIAARKYQYTHHEECPLLPAEEDVPTQDLFVELRRIYAMEGGKEAIERAQKEALIKLDAFEKMLQKRSERRPKN
jgi:hypothetical protein